MFLHYRDNLRRDPAQNVPRNFFIRTFQRSDESIDEYKRWKNTLFCRLDGAHGRCTGVFQLASHSIMLMFPDRRR